MCEPKVTKITATATQLHVLAVDDQRALTPGNGKLARAAVAGT